MRQVEEVRRALRRYSPLQDVLGVDEVDEVKVYNTVAPEHATPPYLIVNFPPLGVFEGAYEEDIAMETVGVQLTSWNVEPGQALIIAEMAQDAFLHSDYDVAPYDVVSLKRIASPLLQYDPVAQLHGVVVRYEMILAK
jgi:hypothetical protein